MRNLIILASLYFIIPCICFAQNPPDPKSIYERLRSELGRVQSYEADIDQYTARGPNHEIYAKRSINQRCLKQPRKVCHLYTRTEYSFPEQATQGYQECYNSEDDISRLALPGAYKALGIIEMYPEDPKAYYINGENLKYECVWDFLDTWDRMLVGGQISAKKVQLQGKPHYLLTIHRGSEPDPDYHILTAKIWVRRSDWFPVRIEYFHAGQPKRPAAELAYRDINLNAGFKQEDIDFQGFILGWSPISSSTTPELERLEVDPPEILGQGPENADQLLQKFSRALESVNDYQVNMLTWLRFYRLRMLKQERFLYLAPEKAFGLQIQELDANYILLGGTRGARMYYAPSKSDMIHILSAGVYKVMGEQTFTTDDPRLFSSMGDNVQELNFFAILDKIQHRRSRSTINTAMVKAGSITGPMIELETSLVGPREPAIMRVIFDSNTSLPARLEFRGYADPQAFCVIEFRDLKLNPGLTINDITFKQE